MNKESTLPQVESTDADDLPGGGATALQHRLGAIYGGLAMGIAAAVALVLWLNIGGPTMVFPDPDELVDHGCARPLSDEDDPTYTGAECDTAEATKYIIEITEPVEAGRPVCPFGTDELMKVFSPTMAKASNAQSLAPDEDHTSSDITGIGCVRNLSPDHPGDPGAGGGQLVAGDCAYKDESSALAEAPCWGEEDDPQPEYTVLDIQSDPSDCPKETPERIDLWPNIKFGDDGYLVACVETGVPEES